MFKLNNKTSLYWAMPIPQRTVNTYIFLTATGLRSVVDHGRITTETHTYTVSDIWSGRVNADVATNVLNIILLRLANIIGWSHRRRQHLMLFSWPQKTYWPHYLWPGTQHQQKVYSRITSGTTVTLTIHWNWLVAKSVMEMYTKFKTDLCI